MPPHDVTVEHREDDSLDEEIHQMSEDLSTLLETMRDMVVTLASLKERPVDETSSIKFELCPGFYPFNSTWFGLVWFDLS